MNKVDKTEGFKHELQLVTHGDWVLVPGQHYKNNTTPLTLQHSCGHIQDVIPKSFRARGIYCHGCHAKVKNNLKYKSRRAGKSPEEFKKEILEALGPEYELLSTYTKQRDKIHIRHKVCNTEKWVYPNNILHEKYGCPHCAAVAGRKDQMKNQPTFEERMKKEVGNEYTILTPFVDMRTIVKLHHNVCNHDIWITPNDFLNNHRRCKYCHSSRGEAIILNILDRDYGLKENKDYFYGFKLSNGLHLDFYFPGLHLAFEYDGEQHYHPIKFFGGQKVYDKLHSNDLRKDVYCKEKHIKLIRIPYTVLSRDGIKSILSKYIK